jgi:hypothetical protein
MKLRLAPILWSIGMLLLLVGVFGNPVDRYDDDLPDRALVGSGLVIAAAILMSALDRFRPPAP